MKIQTDDNRLFYVPKRNNSPSLQQFSRKGIGVNHQSIRFEFKGEGRLTRVKMKEIQQKVK